MSGKWGIIVKAESFHTNAFWGQQDNLKHPRGFHHVQFLTAFFTLLRYEDEIRLCSGMEYTFMELKKVSGKRSFSPGQALRQLCVVTEEPGEARWSRLS